MIPGHPPNPEEVLRTRAGRTSGGSDRMKTSATAEWANIWSDLSGRMWISN